MGRSSLLSQPVLIHCSLLPGVAETASESGRVGETCTRVTSAPLSSQGLVFLPPLESDPLCAHPGSCSAPSLPAGLFPPTLTNELCALPSALPGFPSWASQQRLWPLAVQKADWMGCRGWGESFLPRLESLGSPLQGDTGLSAQELKPLCCCSAGGVSSHLSKGCG